MDGLIVLLNFNEYLGGGETLMVRYSEYLKSNKINFLSFCSSKSYVYSDLKKKIDHSYIRTTALNYNYFYLSELKRKELLYEIKTKIGKQLKVSLVSFNLRDLHIAFDLKKQIENLSITHLLLHPQDQLYLGQSLLDKLIYKLFLIRRFSFKKNIEINIKLLNILNDKKGLISMGEIHNLHLKDNFGIQISDYQTVPLPSFIDLEENKNKKVNTKKIIWIGRLVDFKIPAIVAMIHFVSSNSEYELSIVGSGDLRKVHNYMNKYSLNTKRVHFLGEIPYENLEGIINQHSIGYAMGTSLIELAKYKIPIIIALASFNHQFFKRQICGGLFFDKPKGCDGADLMLTSPENINTTINNSIKEIEFDFENISQNCYDYAKNNFSFNTNFKRYTEIINRTKILTEKEKQLQIPKSSMIRKFVFKCFGE
jgi:glycosyltransferase involved in cell wall biosynthesis